MPIKKQNIFYKNRKALRKEKVIIEKEYKAK